MTASDHAGSMGESRAFAALSAHIERAARSTDTLKTILWMVGAHPQLLAHARVFSNLAELLQTDTFLPGSLYWSSAWHGELSAWKSTLTQIRELEPALRKDLELESMYRAARHDRDHPLLRHGVTRHPIAAALFNRCEQVVDMQSSGVGARFESLRAHVLAIYFEARWRAAQGRDEFMRHTGLKEFAAVPVGAGPIGLCLREFSLAKYSPLLLQLPVEACTVDFARAMSTTQPDYSRLARENRQDAARYLTDLQRYMNALPGLLHSTDLSPRTRKGDESGGGDGGHELRPGWLGEGARITRQLDLDWGDNAPAITQVILPSHEEPDPNEEEVDGDCPGATRDTAIELYDAADAASIMSTLRFRQLALELRQQGFPWSLDMASPAEHERALRVAQRRIDEYLTGKSRNQTAGRHRAIGGVLVKAAALYGWTPETTAAIAARRIDALDMQAVESTVYVRHDQVTLLATRLDHDDGHQWTPHAFLVPGLAPTYATQLPADVAATGRLRQSAFLLADVGGLGRDLLAIAACTERLPTDETTRRRVLGVEAKTARTLANECVNAAADPVCDDSRAALTVGRLCSSLRSVVSQVSGDALPSWIISHHTARASEARLHYTLLRASKLATWHVQALALLCPGMADNADAADSVAKLQSGWVGCRYVADLDQVRRLLEGLRAELCRAPDLERRSEIRRYHNSYTLQAWLSQALPLGLRPTVDGPSLNHVHELRRGLELHGNTDAAGIVDKHHAYQDKARLIPMVPSWQTSVEQLEWHNAEIIQRLDLLAEWQALDAGGQRAFVITEEEALEPVTPAWIKAQLKDRGFAMPVNFGRALLRTEWLDQGCNGRHIDALLGHFSHGQTWYSKHSSHDPAAYLATVAQQLSIYVDHLHLKLTPSLFVPPSGRCTAQSAKVHLPTIGLKAPPARPSLRPMWTGCNTAPELPEPAQGVWSLVARHSASADRPVLVGLLWTLKNSANPHSKVLTGRLLADTEAANAESARALEDELLLTMQRHAMPRTHVASWLRLVLAAVRRMQDSDTDIATTMVAAITSPPDSPVTPKATLRLPDLMTWRAALYEWIRLRAADPDDDPRDWAVAIVISAAIHGMAFDLLLLARLMERLAEPGPRRLQLCGSADGPSFVAFWLPSATPGGQQLTRWFLDPITELLILRAPPFPQTPTLRSMANDLNRFLLHHGAPLHRCPGSWRTVVRTTRAFWSTRVPQHLVQVGHRGISTTSLKDSCWHRLFGNRELQSSRPGSTPLASVKPAAELTLADLTPVATPAADSAFSPQAERETAIAGASAASGADFDHVVHDQRSAHPWMLAAWDALAPGSSNPDVTTRLEALQQSGTGSPFRMGALGWLMRATTALQREALPEGGDSLIGMHRVVSTLFPRLLAETGDRWFVTMTASESAAVLGAMTHELETDASRPDLRRGLQLLLRFEPALAALAPQAPQSVPADEDELDDDRVDARMLTIDEYERALTMLRNGIDPPLSPVDRQDLQDLLHLGTWSLARPREYLESRLGDFEQYLNEVTMIVREFPDRTLKTPQAVRRVPLSIIAPAPVVERLRDRILRLLNQHAEPTSQKAQRSLLFAPPPGVNVRDHHKRLLGLLRQVLRLATSDTEFRVYSLRHSAANWMLLALEGKENDVWKEVWAAHPSMAKWLDARRELRQRLLGSDDRTDRRALLAITKIQGHLSVATTYMHYLHLPCLLQLQAARELADELPRAVIADAAGIAPSSLSEQSANGWQHVIARARARAGWTVIEGREPAKPLGEIEGADRWLTFDEIALLLNAHALHRQPLPAIAQHFQIKDEQAQAIIQTASEVQRLIDANQTGSSTSAGTTGVLVPAARMSDAERLQLGHLLKNMQASWLSDRDQTRSAVALLVDRMDRHHREWRFRDPNELRQCAVFLEGCKIAPGELQIVLRRRSQAAGLPIWALAALGPYAASCVKAGQPDTLSSDAALEQWVCIRLVDRRGDGIPNVAARALFAAWLNMAAAAPSKSGSAVTAVADTERCGAMRDVARRPPGGFSQSCRPQATASATAD